MTSVVKIEVSVLLMVMISETVMVVWGTFGGGGAPVGPGGDGVGPRVMVDGTAVMIPGFSGI